MYIAVAELYDTLMIINVACLYVGTEKLGR